LEAISIMAAPAPAARTPDAPEPPATADVAGTISRISIGKASDAMAISATPYKYSLLSPTVIVLIIRIPVA